MTKILVVRGESPFAALEFSMEPLSLGTVFDDCMKHGGTMVMEVYQQHVSIQAYQFDKVPSGFIELMEQLKDETLCRTVNWFLVK